MKSNPHTLVFHPGIALAYGCIAMVLAMAFIQPAFSAIAFAGVATFDLIALGARSFAKRLLWQISVIAGITLLNAVFVQRGATVLLSAGDFGIHEESLLYGLSMGLALAAAMEIFAILGEVIQGDEVVALMGERLPSSALLASMSLRLIPRMRRNAEERRDALRASTALPRSERKLRAASEEVSAMIANAMEDSLVTADSMRARGYGAGRNRTQYARRSFSLADGIALACIIGFGALAFAAGMVASSYFTFYPSMANGANGWECAAYAVFFLLPHAAYLLGLAKWHLARGGA